MHKLKREKKSLFRCKMFTAVLQKSAAVSVNIAVVKVCDITSVAAVIAGTKTAWTEMRTQLELSH